MDYSINLVGILIPHVLDEFADVSILGTDILAVFRGGIENTDWEIGGVEIIRSGEISGETFGKEVGGVDFRTTTAAIWGVLFPG
jgi:hypothetical protein